MSFRADIVKYIMEKSLPTDYDFETRRSKIDKLSRYSKSKKGVKIWNANVGGVECSMASIGNSNREKLIIYFHGGGFCFGSFHVYKSIVSQLAYATGVKVLYIEYPLAPEHPYPAALEALKNVYKDILRQGYKAKDIIFVGDSAGGGLCLSSLLELKKGGDKLPAAAVLFSPWADLTQKAGSIEKNKASDPIVQKEDQKRQVIAYVGDEDVTCPSVSPVFGDFLGLPPLLVHVAKEEILVDDALKIGEKVKEAGGEVRLKVWKGVFHVFSIFPQNTPEGKASFCESVAFIKEKLEI